MVMLIVVELRTISVAAHSAVDMSVDRRSRWFTLIHSPFLSIYVRGHPDFCERQSCGFILWELAVGPGAPVTELQKDGTCR